MMEKQTGTSESRFADLIWENEPITTSELVHLAESEFHWKRTTTHTVIRRLCDKGLFVNRKGTVTSLISRKEFYAARSREYVDTAFSGSLPAFIAAFTDHRTLSAEEADEIRRMIDAAEER